MATLLVRDVSGKPKIASFYDVTPGRHEKSIEQQLADQVGVEKIMLFG
jgi:hypothetical protein